MDILSSFYDLWRDVILVLFIHVGIVLLVTASHIWVHYMMSSVGKGLQAGGCYHFWVMLATVRLQGSDHDNISIFKYYFCIWQLHRYSKGCLDFSYHFLFLRIVFMMMKFISHSTGKNDKKCSFDEHNRWFSYVQTLYFCYGNSHIFYGIFSNI